MVSQSTRQSLGQREQRTVSLLTSTCSVDSSIHQEESSIGGSEHLGDASLLSLSDDLGREEDKLSNDSSSLCSSNNTSASEYSRESDSDLSTYADCSDGITGLELVLQMSCMDALFLPLMSKKKSKKSIIKLNRKGEKELNLHVKGPLALGLEAKMKDEVDASNLKKTKDLSLVLEDNTSRTNPKVSKTISTLDKDRTNEDKLAEEEVREPEFDHLGSLMSLSHDGSSSSEDEHCNISEKSSNLVSPPLLLPSQHERKSSNAQTNSRHHLLERRDFHQKKNQHQNFHQPYHQQGNQQHHKSLQGITLSHDIIVNGRMSSDHNLYNFNTSQNKQRIPQKVQGKPLRSPLSTGSMPSQILVEEQCSFEEESHLSYEVSMAPDPPSLSLSRIEENYYPDDTSSEERSNSSITARRSLVSRTRDDDIINLQNEASTNSATKPNSKKGLRLPKVERWRKANSKRLKHRQNGFNSASSIKEDSDVDEHSVDSDQASYGSKSTSELQTTRSHGNADNNIAKKIDPQGDSLVFDSIFTRRIEKRRASKLKKNKLEENFSDITNSKDLKDGKSPLQHKSHKSQDSVESNSPCQFHNVSENSATALGSRDDDIIYGMKNNDSRRSILKPFSTSPPAEILDQSAPQVDSSHNSFIIEALATAGTLTLNKNLPSSDYPSFDEEDTENQVPLPAEKGKFDLQRRTKQLKGADDAFNRPKKNPFHDDDLLGEQDFYGDDSDHSPSLIIFSNDDADVLQPLFQLNSRRGSLSSFHSAKGISSPLASSRDIHMTPSPYCSSSIDTSPRHNNEWNNDIQNLSSHIVSTKLERCPSGILNRTDSIKCTNSADALSDGDIEGEFFDSNMYSTQIIEESSVKY